MSRYFSKIFQNLPQKYKYRSVKAVTFVTVIQNRYLAWWQCYLYDYKRENQVSISGYIIFLSTSDIDPSQS